MYLNENVNISAMWSSSLQDETFTENSIPNYKNASIVLIDAVRVSTVMNPVVTRSVQNVLERSYVVDGVRVDPELIDQVHVTVDQED